MSVLTPLVSNSNISLYALNDQYQSQIRRFIFSTAETRAIINDPFVFGTSYTQKLQKGLEYFFQEYKTYWPFPLNEEKINVMHFLRGGLNFNIRDALANIYHWTKHGASFLSSQRAVDENGRWYIIEDSYEKITIRQGNVVMVGDVTATGVTLDHGLNTLTKLVKEQKGSIKYMVFFTIGCHKAEKVLEKYNELWQKVFADFQGMDLVYIEGKFHLADTKTPVTIKTLGTDLLKRNAILTPELIASQKQKITFPLEKCAIYDAGSRAFDIPVYLREVIDYWKQNMKLARQGMTIEKLLQERYPEADEELKGVARGMELERICEEHVERLEKV